jgi:8-oxo-dGTP diphosphatase
VEIERAGVLVFREGKLALIERHRQGRHFWAIPGGGVKAGETVVNAALREAEEELGVPVEVGSLRVRFDHRQEDGSIQRQWYFEATVKSESIHVVGPEAHHPEMSSYDAVWIGLNDLDTRVVYPAVAHLVVEYQAEWPDDVIEVVEI